MKSSKWSDDHSIAAAVLDEHDGIDYTNEQKSKSSEEGAVFGLKVSNNDKINEHDLKSFKKRQIK